MAAPILSELNSLREELRTVTNTLASIELRLEQVATRHEAQVVELHSQTNNLQNLNQEMSDRIRSLETENAELERKIKAQEPKVRNAVEARNDAIRRLRHTRRVLKDVMYERKTGLNFNPPGGKGSADVPGDARTLTMNDVPVTPGKRSSSGSSSSLSSSGSDKTARPSITGLSPLGLAQGGRTKQLTHVAPTTLASPVIQSVSTAVEREVTSPTLKPSSERLASSAMRQGPALEVAKVSAQKWKLNQTSPPRISRKQAATLIPDLHRFLNLSEYTNFHIGSLPLEDVGLRIHFELDQKYAFVIDPILIERISPAVETYLIDWAPQRTNERIMASIRAATGNSGLAFHTFSYLSSQGKWFYIGAYSFSIAKFAWSVWPTLSPKSRRSVITKMKERDDEGKKTEEAIESALDTAELVQLCIKMVNDGQEHLQMDEDLERRLEERGQGTE